MRTPVAPIGWPSEMPEPFGLTRSSPTSPPRTEHREDLARERLVDLDEVDVGKGDPRARFQPCHGRNRTHAHRRRIAAGRSPADEEPRRRQVEPVEHVVGDDEARGGGVVLLTGVPCRDRAARQRRSKPRQ